MPGRPSSSGGGATMARRLPQAGPDCPHLMSGFGDPPARSGRENAVDEPRRLEVTPRMPRHVAIHGFGSRRHRPAPTDLGPPMNWSATTTTAPEERGVRR